MYRLDLEKAEEPKYQIANICWIMKKWHNSRKTFTSASLTTLKSLTVWITTNFWKFLKRDGNSRLLLPASCETYMQLELDMEQQTGSKSGKEYVKAIYCHPVYLTYK